MSLIEFLAHLDWIERVGEVWNFFTRGPSWRFCVTRKCGHSGKEIEQMLKRYGIPVWGRNFDGDHLYFRVKLAQANWAEYLLLRGGVSLESDPFNPKNSRARNAGAMPAPWSERPRYGRKPAR